MTKHKIMQKNTPTKKTHETKSFNFLLLAGIIVIAALVLAAILSILTPSKEKVIINDFVTNNYDSTQSTFKKVSFSGEKISVPELFNIYRAENSTNIADELAYKLINEYGLTANEEIANYWLGDKNSLTKNSYEHYYTFNSVVENQGNSNLIILAEEAISVCQKFYSKYNILSALVPQKDDLIYLNSGFEQNVVDSGKATFLQIPLTYELDGYKVFYENQNNYPFFCRVNNFYTLERVVFRDFFLNFQVLKQLSSISIDQAVNNIKDGNASIIKADSKMVSAIDLSWINSADLYTVKIEYRYDEKLKIAYPFYRFEAKIVNSGGIDIQAEIITPAVEAAKEK